MLHPIDYRLSKNKFWLSTWNSYSLKNYKNLILNDKILNILGYIFKNCFKVSYSFASPWSNPRKYRKYFSNFIIGFDGRRAIRISPNKVKKLPGFIIPEDYNIIRFNNFSILKIYFLIDKNLDTYWAKKQKNWRSPLRYFNMRYNKNRNSEDKLLKFNRNLILNNIEKKNYKITGFFIYLINLLNNNTIKQHLYLNISEQINFFKKDKRDIYLKFYYDNKKLLNKIRNNYFLFYLSNKNNYYMLKKLGFLVNKNFLTINNFLSSSYFKKFKIKNNNKSSMILNFFSTNFNYNDFLKYKNFSILNKKSNLLYSLKFLLRQENKKNLNFIDNYPSLLKGVKKYVVFNKIKYKIKTISSKNFINHIYNKIQTNFLYKNKQNYTFNTNNIITNKFNTFYFNVNKKIGIGLFLQDTNFSKFKLSKTSYIYFKSKLFYKNNKNSIFMKYKKNWELHLLNNINFNKLYNKQYYNNYRYIFKFLKQKFYINKSDILNKINSFNKLFYIINSATKRKFNISTIYSNINWLYVKSISYLINNNKFKHHIKKKNKNSFYFFQLLDIITFKKKIYFSDKQKSLWLKKNIYFNYNFMFKANTNTSKKIIKKNKVLLKKKQEFYRINWGKICWSINNFFKKKKYLYYINTKDSNFYSFHMEKFILNKKMEYNTFLKINNFNTEGYNLYKNSNFNLDNNIFYTYFYSNVNKISFISYLLPIYNRLIYSRKKILSFKEFFKNWYHNKITIKNFKIFNLSNLYYKKTFSSFLNRQENLGKENINRINYRLEVLTNNKFSKLYKFKPYSLKSISKMHSNRLQKSVVTNYLYNNIKKKYITNFLYSMKNRKQVIKTNKIAHKAQITLLFNNILSNKFHELKSLYYFSNSWDKKLKMLLFFHKKIKNKDSFSFSSQYKKTNFLLSYSNLVSFKIFFFNYLQKTQFYYFKSKKNQKGISNRGSNEIFMKPFNSLLYNNYFILNSSNNNNILSSFKLKSYKSIDYYLKINDNNYKYKLNIYNYLNIKKHMQLKQYYIPLNFKKNKLLTIVPLTFKKSNLLYNKNFIYDKSNNLLINRYVKTRLSNIFLSKDVINNFSKVSKLKSENFNYRIYGLIKRMSDVKSLNKKDFKKIDLLKPKTFLYWKHLKWFNVFIKTRFNFKFNSFYNSYSIFKLYENFKHLNFSHFKNYKKFYNNIYYNSFSSFKYDYQKLNNLIFYSTIFKTKKTILSTYFLNRISCKKALLLNWTQDLIFFSSASKRLNYIPHLRFKPIKDSLYMWRINLRKFILLSKYYKARTKFYKKKINFASNNNIRTNIINYLKVMESNFLRIKKTMQRELPLIFTKRYLLTQLKKLNNYIKIVLRRYKKRLNFESKFKIKSIPIKNNNIFLNENRVLSKKLFTFVTKRFFLSKKNFIDYLKKFIEHLFLVIFKFNNLRLFYIKKYRINIMSTKAKLFKNLFNYRLATGFKIPFLVKVICKKLNYDKSLVGCKIGFFGRYSKKLRNRKIWRYLKHLKPSVISTPLDYYNILILQKWGITGIKLSMLKKKTFNFIFT